MTVARGLQLAGVLLAIVGVNESAPALTIDAPPECRVRNEYGFECHAKYLAGLERQVRGILTEIASYNSVHHTLFEPKESQSVWERSRQTRCGESPSWDPGKIDQSFTQMQCYLDITEDRFQQLDNFVHQLPP